MIRFILCEGKTDAVLLSYYLGRTKGWVYDKNPKKFKLKFPETDNRHVANYRNDNETLVICAVGGKDNFINFYKDNIEEYITTSESTDLNYKLAFVIDRDDRETKEIEDYFSSNLNPHISEIRNGTWTTNYLFNKFEQATSIDVLCLIVPHESQGALENQLMDALSEEPYKEKIINKSKEFVEKLALDASEILSTERLKLKTKLGVSLAVLYPEKVFSLIDEQLRSISWESSEILAKTFEKLLEI